jgi:hypothetical protein
MALVKVIVQGAKKEVWDWIDPILAKDTYSRMLDSRVGRIDLERNDKVPDALRDYCRIGRRASVIGVAGIFTSREPDDPHEEIFAYTAVGHLLCLSVRAKTDKSSKIIVGVFSAQQALRVLDDSLTRDYDPTFHEWFLNQQGCISHFNRQMHEWLREFLDQIDDQCSITRIEERVDNCGVVPSSIRPYPDKWLGNGSDIGVAQQESLSTQALLPAGGSESTPALSDATEDQQQPVNLFWRSGDVWEIAFNGGKPFHLKNRVGVRYIHLLLCHPNDPIGAMEMVTKSGARGAEEQPAANIHVEEADEEKLPIYDPASGGEMVDSDTLQQYKERLEDIREERDRANAMGDDKRVAKLDHEEERILQEMKRSTGLWGRPRAFTNDKERARNSVTQEISRAYKTIKTHDPQLVKYLTDTITRSYSCIYVPSENPPKWKLT